MEKRRSVRNVGLILFSLLLLASMAAVVACGKGEKTLTPTVPTEGTASPTPTLTATPISTPTATLTATPKLTPTKTATPTLTPTLPPGFVAEALILMVTPAQSRILNLSVLASDSVQFFVNRIAPADVPIECNIKSPYNEVILDLAEIKGEFGLDAVSSGNYTIQFSISPILLTNAVLFVEVRHRGPTQFPYFGGNYIVVEHGKTEAVNLTLNYGDRLQGSFTIQGGNADLLFSILDPSGNVVGWAGMVAQSYNFAVKVNTSGQFRIVFDNALSTSTYTTKLITLQYSVSR